MVADSPDARAERTGGRIPLVVGVTGHRDLLEEQVPRIEDEVRRVLGGLLDAYPDTPLVVLSPLAEGADRIVARVALEMRAAQEPGRIAVYAPLPLPREAYVVDFAQEGSAAAFDDLLEHVDGSFRVPWPEGDRLESRSAEDLARDPGSRARAYAWLGSFLARRCHVLVAIWNGRVEGAEPGGTAQVVAWFQGEPPPEFDPEFHPLDTRAGLRLAHVPAARQGDPRVESRTPARTDEASQDVFGQIEEFNRDAAAAPAEHHGPVADVPGVAPYRRIHAVADSLSLQRFQRAAVRHFRAILVLAVVGIALLEIYSHLQVERVALVAGYLLAFGLSWLILVRAKRRRLEDKYLVYRFLAEVLRVQAAWTCAGLRASAGEHYERLHRSEIEWVRQAVKGLHVRSLAEATPGREHAGGPAGVRRAYEEWVEDQHAWYGARTREAHAANRRFEFASKLLVGVAFLLAGVLLILGLCDTHLAYGWHAVMLVATFLALALAAALHAYERKRGYGALVRRYAPMRDLFAVAARRGRACIDAGDLSGARGVLQSLGVEVLAENTSWLSLHRDHPMEVHTG